MKTPESVVADREGHELESSLRGGAVSATSIPHRTSGKVQARHLERWAVVYVRQSSPQQVANNRESRERQYELVERAIELGWPRDRVRVIDDDQGQSGKSTVNRSGFQELLVDVSLDHVGLILGLEMSRMSRSCRDAYQLMEVCAVFATLLGDFDGIYDPTDVNDRLLLGLKATISEVELHTMRSRLQLGKLHKARRGELFSILPRGYIRTSAGDIVLDPDEQVQVTLRLVFTKFAELKSVHAVLRYLAQAGIRLPLRPHRGAERGQLVWREPLQSTLQQLLRNPMYAGAYCYGRSSIDPRRVRSGHSGSGRRWRSAEQAEVLLQNCLPAYMSWEQYQENQRQMSENRSRFDKRGVARRGSALLAGLLVCGRCGYRLRVCYSSHSHPRYMCSAHQALRGQSACQSLEGKSINDLVAGQVLRALEPAALELSLLAGADVEEERRRLQKQWELRIERARYDSERAARQFHAVEPENRLVARELERGWESALAALHEVEAEYQRWQHDTPPQLTSEERRRIESLARDIPALWNAPQTTDADRKAITRLLIEKIVVNVEGESELVQARIHWAGGYESHHEFCRRVAGYQQLANFERLLERVATLRAQDYTRDQIAERLNAEGYRAPQRGAMFRVGTVGRLLTILRSRTDPASQRAATGDSDIPTQEPQAILGPDEWWAADLARTLSLPLSTLHHWHRCGWLVGRKHRGWPARWIYYADNTEMQRLQSLRDYRRPTRKDPYPQHLTTPSTSHIERHQ